MLTDPGRLRALTAAVAAADGLVLLGDVIELRQGPLRDAIAAARGPLEAIAAALPGGAPALVLAGNHDHRLVAPWLERREPEPPLGVESTVDPEVGGPLAGLVDHLGASRTTVAYPGAWLSAGVWATHGHYGDRHTTTPMLERLGAGVMARVAREGPDGPRRAEDYEAALGPMYAWIDAVAQAGGARGRAGDGASAGAWAAITGPRRGGLRRRALAAAFPVGIAALNRARIGPLSSDLSAGALRRGALRAMGEVLRRLGVPAQHLVFGHTHRAGPLPGDDPAPWRTPEGTRLINCGCWVRETTLLGPDPAASPYRPGFAVWVDGDPARAPELVNLLD